MKHLKLLTIIAALFISGSALQAQSTKQALTQALEEFCQSQYKNCFGQQYQSNSIKITSIEINESNGAYFVKGTHSYTGKAPLYAQHIDQPFEAYISEGSLGGVKVKFRKQKNLGGFQGEWTAFVEKTIIVE